MKEKNETVRKIFTICTALLATTFSLCACGISGQIHAAEAPCPVSAAPSRIAEAVAGRELICLCDTRQEAEAIAELYEIELVEYSYGVAGFHAEGDLFAIIDHGRSSGWPELSINGTGAAYSYP